VSLLTYLSGDQEEEEEEEEMDYFLGKIFSVIVST